MSRATNYLKRWLDKRNGFESIFNGEVRKMPTTKEECKPLFDIIFGELSPENLCCDGELPHSQVVSKKKRLDWAWKGLEEIYGEPVSHDEVIRWWREENEA